MAKDPAFLFYSQDFYMGTIDLSAEQVGQYIRLLCLQHAKGRLTKSLMISTMGGRWDSEIADKFIADENHRYYNERLEVEISKRRTFTESRRRNLRPQSSHMDTHMDAHMERHMENENEIENKDENGAENSTLSGTNIPPKVSDVRAYCDARGNSIDPEWFVNYYETRGWMAGKAKMKNWQSAIRTWEKNAATMQPKATDNVIWADQMREGEQT